MILVSVLELSLGYKEAYYTKPTSPNLVNDKVPLNLSIEFGFRGIDDTSIFTNKLLGLHMKEL